MKKLKTQLNPELEARIEDFIDNLYLDAQAIHGSEFKFTEEYIIKVLTRFVISICTVYWSLNEIALFIKNRQELKRFMRT